MAATNHVRVHEKVVGRSNHPDRSVGVNSMWKS